LIVESRTERPFPPRASDFHDANMGERLLALVIKSNESF
jgi:hypothetical protein